MWPDLDPDSMGAFMLQNEIDHDALYGDERPVECRYCKRVAFYWTQTDKGWRLTTETGRIHRCKAYRR